MRIFAALFCAALITACVNSEPSPAASESEAQVVAQNPATEEKQFDAPAASPIGEIGGMCGGIAGFQCLNERDYCAYREGECISIADAAGVCTHKPEVCTMDYNPVCGCDGKTYGNSCAAASAGVSVASRGECDAKEPVSE